MKIELECINCGNKFQTDFKFRDKKFCNRKCYFEYARKYKLLGREKDESIREERQCLLCGATFSIRKKQENKLCSDECRKKWNALPENQEKRLKLGEDALVSKYGVKSSFSLNETQEKTKKTMLKRYGCETPMHSEILVEKLKNTFREKQLKSLLPKLKEHNLELLDEYSKNKNGNTSINYRFKCLKCDNVFTNTQLGCGIIPICRKCYPIRNNSKIELDIKNFLTLNGIQFINHDKKTLNGLEIDILIPELNIGIEVNGNYWHSELFGGKSKEYHINKSILANKKGVKLIHIFEDEIILKKEIVFSRLLNIFNLSNRIFARKCKIQLVDKKISAEFLGKNHLQGDSIDKIRLGLYYNNELISIMTFGDKRKSLGVCTTKNEYELIRFSNKLNTNVVGGFSKLLNYFIKNYNVHKIISYADIRWSGLEIENLVYSKNGFNFISKTPPNYWYVKIGEFLNRSHRFVFRKDVLVEEGFDPSLTEFEIMKLKGYDKIWDCGSLKFEFVVTPTGASFENV